MFLKLGHTTLEVYPLAHQLVLHSYTVTRLFPTHERFGLSTQIQRAATSIVLNIAEGSAHKSVVERCRYYEVARASLIELDAAFEIADNLSYFHSLEHPELGDLIVTVFKKITLLIKSNREIQP